jgi:hypothetical protein
MGTGARVDVPLVNWGPRECERHDVVPFATSHRLQETALFTDAALAALIDRYPRERLQVFTMGDDPLNNSQWAPVDTSGVSGAEMLRAAKTGRLWVKLMRLDLVDRDYLEVMCRAYEPIWSVFSGIQRSDLRPLILISSPGALVYYHADAYPTMLWHVRGSKRFWVYPAADDRFVPPELMEKIYAGEIDEELPYRAEFDRHATVFDLEPGQLLTWPLNAPHRIVNHDSVNVSVSVQYSTVRGERRALVYQANQFLRRWLRLPVASTRDEGLTSALKRGSFRVARKLRLAAAQRPKRNYMAHYRVDGNAPGGMTLVPGGPVKTPF